MDNIEINPSANKDIEAKTLNRARILDQQFISRVKQSDFPKAKSKTTPVDAGLTPKDCLEIFRSQMISRHVDLIARIMREQNQGFYTIASSGHEGNAAIAQAFTIADMAFLHYRSLAFMLQRAWLAGESREKAISDHLLALSASKDDPISGGRHKVFGSLALNVPPQTSTIASHLPKALGTAYSIHLAKELALNCPLSNDAVILASFGDASFNHASAQVSFNAASFISFQKIPLPLVFICEDNEIGISVPTPKHWIENNFKNKSQLEYIVCDGLNFCDVFLKASLAETIARKQKKPVFFHFKTIRLLGHAGSDIETHYHSLEEIEKTEADDPLLHSARILSENNILTTAEILSEYENIRLEIKKLAEAALKTKKLETAEEIMCCIIPEKVQSDKTKQLKPALTMTMPENNKTVAEPKAEAKETQEEPKHMAVLLNRVLAETLDTVPNTLVFGEDVGKKGGVYRISAGLQSKFGKRRVFDTILDEQTILGTAIGLAHNGFLPIPEIQFLAFLHNAEDQIRGEAATLPFFSKGQFTNPMILRLPGLAYQKGFGGHFHNDNAFAFLREIPGLIIACPSNGLDAVKLFRRCVQLAIEERRVIIFLEPIALYMTKDLHQEQDKAWLNAYPALDEAIDFGEFGVYGNGQDILLISYGNGYYLARQAEKELKEKYHINSTLIDLRWLSPLNIKAILKFAKSFKNILIIDECRKTGSLSEEVMTGLMEGLDPLPKIKRITALDCFIPLGEAWQALLPSKDTIIKTAYEMLKI